MFSGFFSSKFLLKFSSTSSILIPRLALLGHIHNKVDHSAVYQVEEWKVLHNEGHDKELIGYCLERRGGVDEIPEDVGQDHRIENRYELDDDCQGQEGRMSVDKVIQERYRDQHNEVDEQESIVEAVVEVCCGCPDLLQGCVHLHVVLEGRHEGVHYCPVEEYVDYNADRNYEQNCHRVKDICD